MIKRFIAAALAVSAVGAPAMAQDAASFTGFRVEGLVGYDSVALPGLKNPDGLLYGIGVGYDFALGGLVAGVEADVTDSTAKLRSGGVRAVTDRDIYVGARIGARVGDAALLYGKVGYTNARIESNFGSENGDGVRLGAGLEYALGANTFVKAEYRYSNYESDVARNQIVGGFGFRF